MLIQLNRFLVLLTLTQPVIAGAEKSQRLVVDGDTLEIQMTKPLPAGLQTLMVDDDTLTVQVLTESQSEDDPPLAISDTGLVRLAQGEPGDTLTVQQRLPPFDVGRYSTKIAAGIASGAVFTATTAGLLKVVIEPSGHPDRDAYRTIAALIFGSFIGCSVGFPLGVTLVDPNDSFSKTLHAGIMPGLAGYALLMSDQSHSNGIAALLMYVVPVINSFYASEKWRKPPESRRVSFDLVPTFKVDLSVSAILHF